MKVGSKKILTLFVIGLLTAFITACSNQTKPATDKSEKSNFVDTINHGYNELANPDNRKTFTISDFNTDNQEIKNIERPSVSTISTNLDTALLFWNLDKRPRWSTCGLLVDK
ncbi:MAG: hypothetical protein IPI10_13585 [Bacteroidetes bacterium]|nr:hypothetical protein [Bacteroidota bacterium]